ncbi:hypothetical protein FHL15_004311 [Xylaria flabelliformis]|uniref:Uncharacterized protein n=1 Tax=Xylaria flabelliformis TaxID=2512241 RepID=A0A553I3S7_9PEZI|nr:hypothetical protein FHL15_004311 [Xylaria flabelliformis]
MAIPLLIQQTPARRPVKSPRRELRTPTAALKRCPRSPGNIDRQLGFLNPWDGTNSPTTPSHLFSFSNEPVFGPRSPVPTGSFSPGLFSPISVKKEESSSPRAISLSSRNTSAGSLKRKSEDDGDGYDNKPGPFPRIQRLLPCHEPHGRSHTNSPLWTPRTTPEPCDGSVYLKRSSLYLAHDPITDGLNHFRIKQNKEPLPPIGALCNIPVFPNHAMQWMPLQQPPGELSQQSSPPPEPRKRRVKPSKTSHCNVKYLVEELDYIRYQRVDYGHKWARVQSSFRAMFPATVFPEPREKQGLQGVCYRQNKFLPHIHNGQLVFMENGHVEAVCVQTREQTEKKHLYTLVYLFPERAMNYPWVSSLDRQRARDLRKCNLLYATSFRFDLLLLQYLTHVSNNSGSVPEGSLASHVEN